MKIIYDYQIFCLQKYGGISRYFFELSRNVNKLLSKSNKVTILSPLYINKYLDKNEVQIKGLRIPVKNNVGKILTIANKFICPFIIPNLKPDIIHQTYYFGNSSFKNFKGKKILTIYDMIHEIYPHHFPNSSNYIKAKKNAVKNADHIICISENTQNDLIRILRIKREKTSVIHLGFLPDEIKSIKSQSSFSKPFILYVGLRDGYKNFRNLLLAYASNSDLKNDFNIISFGGPPFSNKELSFIKELGLSQNKVMYRSGDDSTLKGFYKNASLFVYPSLYEGFGLPPLEAMSCGCPVACSNSSSIPEVVGNAASFFDPRSLDSINNSITSTIYDKSIRDDLVLKGFERIKNFGWDKCAKITLNTYGEVFK